MPTIEKGVILKVKQTVIARSEGAELTALTTNTSITYKENCVIVEHGKFRILKK